jgi:chromosomal replication initiation ATPase DnaA
MKRVERSAAFAVSRAFKVSINDLFSKTRGSPEVAWARQALMYIYHVDHRLNFTRIGVLLGRYRKTVSHGILVTRLRKADLEFSYKLKTARIDVPLK